MNMIPKGDKGTVLFVTFFGAKEQSGCGRDTLWSLLYDVMTKEPTVLPQKYKKSPQKFDSGLIFVIYSSLAFLVKIAENNRFQTAYGSMEYSKANGQIKITRAAGERRKNAYN